MIFIKAINQNNFCMGCPKSALPYTKSIFHRGICNKSSESQEFSGMGCLKIFIVNNKKTIEAYSGPTPHRGLGELSSDNKTIATELFLNYLVLKLLQPMTGLNSMQTSKSLPWKYSRVYFSWLQIFPSFSNSNFKNAFKMIKYVPLDYSNNLTTWVNTSRRL